MFVPFVIGEMDVSAILPCPFDAMDAEFGGSGARLALPIPPEHEPNPTALGNHSRRCRALL